MLNIYYDSVGWMAGPFDTVKGVNTTKEEWKIGVRITDMWIVTNMNNHQHLEMVLMDTKVNSN